MATTRYEIGAEWDLETTQKRREKWDDAMGSGEYRSLSQVEVATGIDKGELDAAVVRHNLTAKYWMSESGPCMSYDACAWHPCKATTVTMAKREAIRWCKGSCVEHDVSVGELQGLGCNAPVHTMATRRIAAGSKWVWAG